MQAQLIISALNMLSEVGVKVWNITCDGTSTNHITLEKLGCDFNTVSYQEIKPYFLHLT